MIGRRGFLQSTGGAIAAGAALSGVLGRAARAAGNGTANCAGATISDGTLSRFRSRISGAVILPSDSVYGSARLVYNQRFDPYPSIIVRPGSESDIARSIEFARINGIRMVVRSGGHSYIGASGGTGMVLDMSSMNAVAPLGDGMFRIGSGARLKRVYGDLRCNGNWTIPCGSCDTVGFGGIAQGGGFGYLQRAAGLTCDRVRSARVVLADGTAVDASPDADADLYWAIRGGGGGSFGVATHFDVEAIPYQTLRVSLWYWPLSVAQQALELMVDLQQSGEIPRTVTAALVFNVGAAALSPPQCVAVLFSTASPAETVAIKQLFVGSNGIPATPGLGYDYDAESPACDPMEVTEHAWYRAKSAMVYGAPASDTGEAIREWLQRRLSDPLLGGSNYGSMNFLTLGGAVADVSPGDTAFPHRQSLLEVQFLGYLTQASPAAVRANDHWIRGTYADVFPRISLSGSGCYVNYCDDDLLESQWPGLYWGANYPRLQATKRRVDPADFFHGRQTVRV
jgi:FAD/FMN-containing dehydrogenase